MNSYESFQKIKLVTLFFAFVFVCIIILAIYGLISKWVIVAYLCFSYVNYKTYKRAKRNCEIEVLEEL